MKTGVQQGCMLSHIHIQLFYGLDLDGFDRDAWRRSAHGVHHGWWSAPLIHTGTQPQTQAAFRMCCVWTIWHWLQKSGGSYSTSWCTGWSLHWEGFCQSVYWPEVSGYGDSGAVAAMSGGGESLPEGLHLLEAEAEVPQTLPEAYSRQVTGEQQL